MRDCRGKKIIKVVSILLVVVFSFQQVAWAFHEDLREEPNAGDYLIKAGAAYISAGAIQPEWSVIDTLMMTYVIPYAATKAVDATGIKNQWVKLTLEVGISVFLSSAYESFRVDERSIGEKADEVTEKAAEEYGRKYTEELAKGATEEAARRAAQEAAEQAAKNALAELQKKLSQEIFDKLKEKVGEDLAKKISTEVTESAMSEIAEQVTAGIAEFTPEMLKKGFWASVARGWKSVVKAFKRWYAAIEKFNNYTAQEKWAAIWKGIKGGWNNLKTAFHNFFLRSRSELYAPPWQRASQEAVKAMTFVAAKYGAYEAYRYLIYGKKDLTTKDEALLEFLSSFTSMPVSFYLGQALEKSTGITEEGLHFDGSQAEQKEALAKFINSERRGFLRKFMIASTSEAIETTAIIIDPDLADLGIVLSAGTSSLLNRALDKENYQARKEELGADKALLESQDKALDSDKNLDAETKSARKKALAALIKYKQSQINQLDITWYGAAGQGALRGLVSVTVKEGVDAVTKGSDFIAPYDVALVAAGAGAFAQAFFVKDENLFVLTKDKQVLQVEGLENNPEATKDIMAPSTGWQRLSLANNLILANNMDIFTDFFTLGRGEEAGLTYDKKGEPHPSLALRPMDIFYYRRLAGAIETMDKDGLGYAMMDQFVSSIHSQATTNIYNIVYDVLPDAVFGSGNLQKPYVLILGKPGYRYHKGIWPVIDTKREVDQETRKIMAADPPNQYRQKTGEKILNATNPQKVKNEIVQERDKLSEEDKVVADAFVAAIDKWSNTYRDVNLEKNRSASAGSLLGLGGGRWYVLDTSLSAADLNKAQRLRERLRQQYARAKGLDDESTVRFVGEEPAGTGGVLISGYDRFYDLFGGRHDVFHARAVPVVEEPTKVMAAPPSAPPEPFIQQVNLATYGKVYFRFDQASLGPEATPVLEEIAAILKTSPDATIEIKPIEGFTDRWGTEEYNFALGEKRAKAVKAFLVASGIPADRIQIISHGEVKAAGALEDPATRAKDRRVELSVWTRTTRSLEAPSLEALPSATIEETRVLETPISLKIEEYTVKEGQNLWDIAKQYYPASKGAACDRIARYNLSLDKSFNPYRLRPGQRILIPIE